MPAMSVPLIEIKHVSKTFGTLPVLNDICLSVYPGEFFTLLGPSGCGKTTLLRLISGFETPTEGDVFINGQCVTALPPQQRCVHTIFQHYALFPHLSVFENVAFGLRCKKRPIEEINTRVHEALALIQLESYGSRRIQSLSGGQQQRVAIARALVNQPNVLLLDEPFSSLDYRLRKAMQRELKQLQQTLNMTFIFVTHDQEEALSMSDRIAVFNQGHIEQIGSPREVYETPTNLHVAQFIGEATLFDLTVQAVSGQELITTIEGVEMRCHNTINAQADDRIHLMVRPEDIRVWGENEVKDTTGMLAGQITHIIYKGSTVDVTVKLASGQLINASEFFDEDDDKLEYSLDERVWVHWFSGWEFILPYEDRRAHLA
jgi:spermidine/putrescine transport system ATP-binding protein